MASNPPYPDFAKEEYDLRYGRARAMMVEQNLDALLVTWATNYMYFTGHRSEQMLNDKIRPYVFLLPREGDPICFVMPFEELHLRLVSWIDEVRTYQLMQHAEVIAGAIRDRGLSNGRIGCELGREQFLGLSYIGFNDLQARIPGASFVDASDILLRLRMVKSPAEVERCRAANIIGARALDQVFKEVSAGMTTVEIAHLVRRCAVEAGGEKVANLAVFAGYDFTKGKIPVPTERPIEVGDTLTIDTSWQVKGYHCDVARTGVIGRASQAQKDQYAFGMELNYKCYQAIKPDNTCEDVALTCLHELERLGRKTQGVGRIGHGVGSDGTEFPSLAVGEKVAFEPGMVMACNPNFVTEFGFFNMEETLVVTETGYDFLPDPISSLELPVLGQG
jgi:Xaa-Pro aminopeptidase